MGICGTDLHEWKDHPTFAPVSAPHPVTKETVPIGFGHEFAGVVTEIGDGVERVKVGDRVAVQPTIYDGDCGACRQGLVNCCYNGGFVGLSGGGGGMSVAVVVDEEAAFILPDGVCLDVGGELLPLYDNTGAL